MSLMWAKNAKNKNKLTDPAISTMYTHCTITHITEIRVLKTCHGIPPNKVRVCFISNLGNKSIKIFFHFSTQRQGVPSKKFYYLLRQDLLKLK